MGRGRNPSVSDERVLLEVLLIDEKLITVQKIASTLPIGEERTRQILEQLESDGDVDVEHAATNFYVLTDQGYNRLAAHCREEID
jgi:predicted ArsR family transcriptional regulator